LTNPLSVAAIAIMPHGPAQGTDALTSMPNGSAYGLGSLGAATTQYYDDNIAPIKITTGTGTSASGTALLYLVVSEDNSIWTNGINPAVNSDQSGHLVGLNPLFTIPANADTTAFYFPEFTIASVLGYMPSFWSVVVWNQSGATFNATAGNFFASHSLISFV
jgi:hypothetical protein